MLVIAFVLFRFVPFGIGATPSLTHSTLFDRSIRRLDFSGEDTCQFEKQKNVGKEKQMKEITDAEGYWLAGFTAGEGCFSFRKNNHDNPRTNYGCQFQIRLRDDDRAILEELRETLGIGNIHDRPVHISDSFNRQPQTIFQVQAIAECAELVKVFKKYPLRAKKGKDFEIWARMVRELQKPIDCRDAELLDYYYLKIKEVRQYEKQAELVEPKLKEVQLIFKYE